MFLIHFCNLLFVLQINEILTKNYQFFQKPLIFRRKKKAHTGSGKGFDLGFFSVFGGTLYQIFLGGIPNNFPTGGGGRLLNSKEGVLAP